MEEIRLEKGERVAGLLSKFLDDMRPARLSWQSPRERCDFWVFWSEEKASHHSSTYSDHHFSIEDRIKTALSAFKSAISSEVLVQFWAATTTMTEGGRRLLTTSDQPFAIKHLTDEKLIQYKKDCPIYKFVAEGEEDHNLIDGPISRVFRSQLPEISPDVSYYSDKEYPERDLALGCGIKATVALPVFEPSLQFCVGVLELLFTSRTSLMLDYYVSFAKRRLQEAGLDTVNPMQLGLKIREVIFVLVEEELKWAMGLVRKTLGLPLACIWARCEHTSSVGRGGSLKKSYNDSDVNCRRELLVSIPGMRDYDLDLYSYNYLLASFSLPLTMGQGPVGKVFHLDKPCFCRDVAQLSIIDYPMAHFACMSRITGCFAVCLQSIATGNRVYVLEFFLPRDKRHIGDLHNFLTLILMILKQHLKSFEVVTGDIGNDLFTEVDNLTESNEEASVVKGKNVICAEQGNTSFTYNTLSTSSGHETISSSREFTSFHTISTLNTYSGYETISSSAGFTSLKTMSISDEGPCTETEDSARSLRTAESTANSMRRKSDIYTGPYGRKSNLDQSPFKINEPLNSETGSSSCFQLFGHMMSASQYQVPTMNECRGDSSLFDAVVACTIPPETMVDVEMVTINEN